MRVGAVIVRRPLSTPTAPRCALCFSFSLSFRTAILTDSAKNTRFPCELPLVARCGTTLGLSSLRDQSPLLSRGAVGVFDTDTRSTLRVSHCGLAHLPVPLAQSAVPPAAAFGDYYFSADIHRAR